MDNTIPTELPDWQNPAEGDYPDPKKATPQEWAWQFLRRNEEYQKNYKNLQILKAKTEPSIKEQSDAANALWRSEKARYPDKRIKRPMVFNKPVDRMKREIRPKFGLAIDPIDPVENRPLKV